MNICMISYSQYEHDNRVHRYSESLVRRGDGVDVICLGSDGQLSEGLLNDVAIYRVQTRDYHERGPLSYLLRMLRFFFLSAYKCTILHLKRKYHVLHFHNIPDFGVFCTLIPKLFGAKVILDIHDLVPEFYQRKFRLDSNHLIVKALKRIERLSAYYANHVITVTTIWEDTLTRRSVPKSKCSVILNAPDPNLFYRRPMPEKDDHPPFRLIYHGNLTEIFGVDLIIKAMKIIRENIPEVELQIYGHGRNSENLKKLCSDLDLQDNVRFNDPVSRLQIPEILSQADIGIDPKRDGVLADEGLSSKCMEYLAMGLPAIVSKIKAARTYYDDSIVKFFEPGNAEDLAQGVLELYRSPQRRRQLVTNSIRFNRKHHWKNYEKKYFDILDHLIQ